jgi:hypothetical protein
MLMTDMTAELVHVFFKNTRFVTESNSETMQLALFVSMVRSINQSREKDWHKNLNRLKAAATAIKKLNMYLIVSSGDMKTVRERVDAAKFAAIKRKFK